MTSKRRPHPNGTDSSAAGMDQPLVSIIIPVHNARRHLASCLEAVFTTGYPRYEVIVVDDASSDGSSDTAASFGLDPVVLARRMGPAAARNRGAGQARGDILLFVDADVVITADTVSRVVQNFADHDVAALFGSYDDSPGDQGFLSQYKNLAHHFVHQQGNPEATTFWAGCGAVKSAVFRELGGFDEGRYGVPSIEDIELGYRIKQQGYRILLDKRLQVKHLKRWTLPGLLRSDILCRALPWTRLMLERGHLNKDLNLQASQRLSAVLTGLTAILAALSLVVTKAGYWIPWLMVAVVLINWKFYRFFVQKKGAAFAIAVAPLHFFYYFYSLAVFLGVWFDHTILKGRFKP